MTIPPQQPSPSSEVNIDAAQMSLLSLPGEDIWRYAPDFLDLPYWRTIARAKYEYDYEVIAEPLTLPVCPDCDPSQMTLGPSGTLVQSVTDAPQECRRVRIHFLRQRFQCSCGRNLLQPLPGVVEGRSITTRGAAHIAIECFDRSFDEVANRAGVSSKTAKELFADLICALEATRMIEAPAYWA